MMPKKTAKKVSRAYSSTSLQEEMKHTFITVLLLVFAYPIGLFVMFTWTKWPMWLKWLVALPLALFFLFVMLPIILLVLLGAHKFKENQKMPTPVVTMAPTPASTPTLAPSKKTMKY